MSEEQTTQQILLLEDFPANHSALQEKEKEQQMIATSGMKLLESLPNANRGGLLEKMLKDLLTSTTAWSSDRCKLIWKTKVSKSNVLLFQLQASVLGIKGKESGLSHVMFQTPTATEIPARSKEAMEKRIAFRKSIGRNSVPAGNLLEQIQTMYPTPTQDSASERTKKYKQGGMPLTMAVKMFPTPTTRDYKDSTVSNSHQNRNSDSLPIKIMKEGKPGGKLNPNFVEFLMGYPLNWTKIDQAE